MIELLKEIFCAYRDKYFEHLKKRGWKKSFYLVPAWLAVLVILVWLII